MKTYEVVLARRNDERHYYPEAECITDALSAAVNEWADEFKTRVVDIVNVREMPS